MRVASIVLLFVVALGVAATGCAGRQYPAMVGEVKTVAIRFTGNDSISGSTLKSGLMLNHLRENSQPYDDYLVVADAERLRGYYYRHGFFKVGVRYEMKRTGTAMDVHYVIEEGAKATLLRVEIAGLPDDPITRPKEIRDLIPFNDGGTIDYHAYELIKPALVEKLAQWGYPHARLEVKFVADRVRNETIIRLDYVPGPLCTFGAVTVDGLTGDLLAAAQRRVRRVQPGGRYSSTKLADAQSALYDIGRFSSVRVAPGLTADNTEVPIAISLIESTRHELRIGGGLGVDTTAYEVRQKTSYTIAGWPMPLINSGAELRLAYQRVIADGTYRPRVEAITSLEKIDLIRPFIRGKLGAFYGDVPVTERFFSGGASNQRGFAERQLAPSATAVVEGDTRSVVIGGGALVEVGGELRFPIGTVIELPIGGVLFVDVADVEDTLAQLQIARLHWATGARW